MTQRGQAAGACRWLATLLLALGPALAAWPAAAIAALRVAVISDLNGSYGSTRYEATVPDAVRRLVELQPDLVISTGDMVAGQRLHPPLAEPVIKAMWASFHDVVTEPLAKARIPLAVTPGNHDASAYATFAMERETFRREWLARKPAVRFVDDTGYPFRYAFAAGNVLFVSLDVTRVGAIDADEKRWLDELLGREAPRFRHRVVFSHLPVYPFTHGRETEVSADHELERILRRHGVEVYLSGHHHAFYPGYREGILFVSQACLGAGPRALLGAGTRSERAITLLEVADDGRLTVRALAAPDFTREIDRSSLPRSIASRYGTLVRDDLRPATTNSGVARVE
jgi:3',5'-cyclic AMP phosphodiesterase CpdA